MELSMHNLMTNAYAAGCVATYVHVDMCDMGKSVRMWLKCFQRGDTTRDAYRY